MNPAPMTPFHRRATMVSVVVLLALTLLGTAPSGPVATVVEDAVGPGGLAVGNDAPLTFQEAFELAERTGEEGVGEGEDALVSVALPSADGGTPSATDLIGPPAGELEAHGLPPVDPLRPALVVRGGDPSAAERLRAVEGVEAVATVQVGQIAFAGMPDEGPLSVAAVEPLDFRRFTPEITATADGVWQRLLAGDAAVTHDAGNRLLVPLGSEVLVDGDRPLRIGAFASNGIPSVADALISTDRAADLGITGPHDVYIGLAEGALVDDVAAAVQAVVTAGEVQELQAPAQQQAFLEGSAAAAFFEPFDYVDHGDGLITIDPGWVSRNIATQRLPIFNGQVTCHRQMLIQLAGALAEVEAAGLAPLIDVTDYGGCWVARHIDWRPDRPLSMHAWGLAVDFNVRTNGLGRVPTMDPRIVAIFDRWGFVWGGRWSRPDGMHFELGAVLTEATTPLDQLTQ